MKHASRRDLLVALEVGHAIAAFQDQPAVLYYGDRAARRIRLVPLLEYLIDAGGPVRLLGLGRLRGGQTRHRNDQREQRQQQSHGVHPEVFCSLTQTLHIWNMENAAKTEQFSPDA